MCNSFGVNEAELLEGLPFLQIDLVEPKEFAIMVDVMFASDRQPVPKGMVEVKIWS